MTKEVLREVFGIEADIIRIRGRACLFASRLRWRAINRKLYEERILEPVKVS